MSYFDQISPTTPHRVVVDLTEFTKPYLAWRAGIEEQAASLEVKLNSALEALNEASPETFAAMVADAAQAAEKAQAGALNFAAFLPSEHAEAAGLGKELQELRAAVFEGPKWTLQWCQISTAQGAIALKNMEIIQRRHPDWGMEQVSVLAFLAAHHQTQAGEPAPGEIYDTLASRSEFVDVWRYVSARFREEFPDIFATDAATLKNVSCGRALALAVAGTPQSSTISP